MPDPNYVSSGSGINSGATITFAIDCTGADYLVVAVCYHDADEVALGVPSVTYNGVSLGSNIWGTAINARVRYWEKKLPATGSNNVVVTFSGVPANTCCAGAQAFKNVNQLNQRGAFFTNGGGSGNSSVAVTDALVTDSITETVSTLGTESNQNYLQAWSQTGLVVNGGGQHTQGGSTTLTWTIGAEWVSLAMAIKIIVPPTAHTVLRSGKFTHGTFR